MEKERNFIVRKEDREVREGDGGKEEGQREKEEKEEEKRRREPWAGNSFPRNVFNDLLSFNYTLPPTFHQLLIMPQYRESVRGLIH